MAVDAQIDLQTAVYTVLTGDATLMAAITGVYDFVPQETAYPYVTIGDDVYEWFGTMGKDGGQYTIQIDTWSQAEGRSEAKSIMKLVAAALHNVALTISGNTHIATRITYQETFKEEDGLTYHGVQQYTVWLQE